MKVNVQTQIIIFKSLHQVEQYMVNPDNVPDWYKNIKSVEWLSLKPVKEGSQIAFVAHFLGKKLVYTYEVVHYIPGNNFIMQTSEGPFPMETEYAWEELENQKTLVTLTNRGNPKGFFKLFSPFLSFAMKRENKKDLSLLKKQLESESKI